MGDGFRGVILLRLSNRVSCCRISRSLWSRCGERNDFHATNLLGIFRGRVVSGTIAVRNSSLLWGSSRRAFAFPTTHPLGTTQSPVLRKLARGCAEIEAVCPYCSGKCQVYYESFHG